MFYFKDDKQVAVYFSNGNIAVWQKDSTSYKEVCELCEKNNWIAIEVLDNTAKAILQNIENITVNKEGSTCIKGVPVDNSNNDPLLNLIKLLQTKGVIDTELTRIQPFLKNCVENPYINAAEELYEYCKAMDFEITEDGCFLAYKNVNHDYSSMYDGGATKHAIGQYTEVEIFDTNRNTTCSSGLHFCSKEYLDKYAGPVTIIVKINPKDVVSIPTVYSYIKGRCRRYVMVGIISQRGSLSTTNIAVATGEKIIKTKAKDKADKKLSKVIAKDRIFETYEYMVIYKNDISKVAKIMNISTETVKRNMRKYRANRKYYGL